MGTNLHDGQMTQLQPNLSSKFQKTYTDKIGHWELRKRYWHTNDIAGPFRYLILSAYAKMVSLYLLKPFELIKLLIIRLKNLTHWTS